jgi:hypothetical protein
MIPILMVSATSGGSWSSMPKSAMIFFISPMSFGPGGISASAW